MPPPFVTYFDDDTFRVPETRDGRAILASLASLASLAILTASEALAERVAGD